MAADVSKIQNRTTQQDRITRNRDQMFSRRNTEQPQARVFADIRNASRGDGGAEELRRTLGMVQDAAGDFKSYTNNKFKETERQNAGQAALDGVAGKQNDELFAKSRAYREGITLARTQRDWFEGLPKLEKGLSELIAQQTDPDPMKRQAEVNDFISKHWAAFAVDEEGNLKDFGSPGANGWLAEQMVSARTKAQSAAFAQIDKKLGEESINLMSETVRARLIAGEELDYKSVLGMVPKWVDPKVAAAAVIETAKLAATDLEARGEGERAMRILNGLIGHFKATPLNTSAASAPAPASAPAAAPAGSLIAPFAGFSATNVRSRIGAARGNSAHNGEDFPTPVGTPIVAPMGGKVVESFSNGRGGNQVIVEMDNGVKVGFAHLDSRAVQKGQRVEAGAQLGLSGNTGRSTGPHVHMTVTEGGRKVSPSEYFSKNPTAQAGAASGPAVPPEALQEQPTVTDLANSQAPLAAPLAPGLVSTAQLLELQEFRRTFGNRVDRQKQEDESERQSTNATGFLTRFDGMGVRPTRTEIQEAVRTRAISPQQGHQLLGVLDSDEREDRAEARAITAEARAAQAEAKRDTVDRHSSSIISKVYSGTLTATQASAETLNIAATIPDRETRQAFIREVSGELGAVVDLRTRGPEYARAVSDFSRWKRTYYTMIPRTLPRGVTRKQAEKLVDHWVDSYVAQLGKGNVPPADVQRYMDTAEKDIDRRFRTTFPPTPKR